jgi:hypothetical protein
MRGALLGAVTVVGLQVTSAGQAGAQPLGPATFLSGEQLLNYCGSDNQATRDGCTGFAMGVADTAAEASAAGSLIGPFRVCRPEEVTGSEARDVIIRFLQAHPMELQYSAASLAIRALAATWPCP